MNRAAEKHLTKAEGHLARGDEFYGKAADEIIAAQQADPTLTQREIAERFGKSPRWVRLLVTWRTDAEPDTPIDWKRGSHATASEVKKGAEKLLREAAPEQIKEILDDLPDEAVAKVAEATAQSQIDRELYPDGPGRSVEEGRRRAARQSVERRTADPLRALSHLGVRIGDMRARMRMLVKEYQDFQALVSDEEILGAGRERLVDLRADIDLAFGQALEGSMDEALERLLEAERR